MTKVLNTCNFLKTTFQYGIGIKKVFGSVVV